MKNFGLWIVFVFRAFRNANAAALRVLKPQLRAAWAVTRRTVPPTTRYCWRLFRLIVRGIARWIGKREMELITLAIMIAIGAAIIKKAIDATWGWPALIGGLYPWLVKHRQDRLHGENKVELDNQTQMLMQLTQQALRAVPGQGFGGGMFPGPMGGGMGMQTPFPQYPQQMPTRLPIGPAPASPATPVAPGGAVAPSLGPGTAGNPVPVIELK